MTFQLKNTLTLVIDTNQVLSVAAHQVIEDLSPEHELDKEQWTLDGATALKEWLESMNEEVRVNCTSSCPAYSDAFSLLFESILQAAINNTSDKEWQEIAAHYIEKVEATYRNYLDTEN